MLFCTYASSVWAHRLQENKSLALKLNRAQRTILLRMSGAYKTTPGEAINVILGIRPLHLEAIKMAAQYWIKHENQIRATEILREIPQDIKDIDNKINQIWQRNWQNSGKSRRLYGIIPMIEQRLKWTNWNPDKGSMHFLSGHGPYKSKLHELKIVESPECSCGQLSTPEHVVLHCPENHVKADGTVDARIVDLRNELKNVDIREIIEDDIKRTSLDLLATIISYKEKEIYMRRMRRNIYDQE